MDAEIELALKRENDPEFLSGIAAEELHVHYRDTEILKGITLQARKGEILSIIGPAGAGKSTFLRCFNRMLDLDPDWRISGSVRLNSRSIYDWDVPVAALRRKVGMVFSVPVTLPMTIRRNLLF